MSTWWVLAVVAAVFALCATVFVVRRERFSTQGPLFDTKQAERAYRRVAAGNYCDCARLCRGDGLCGAFTYDPRDDGINRCTLGTIRSSTTMGTSPAPGSVLTYVTDRCSVADVA